MFGGWPGVRSVAVETERAGHARELVEGLALAELDSYDGIVAVRGSAVSASCELHKVNPEKRAPAWKHGIIARSQGKASAL